MKIKTEELAGSALDFMVAKCQALHPIDGQPVGYFEWHDPDGRPESGFYSPSTDWALGGRLVDQYLLYVEWDADGYWVAHTALSATFKGKTALEAICRAVVSQTYGDEVEVFE